MLSNKCFYKAGKWCLFRDVDIIIRYNVGMVNSSFLISDNCGGFACFLVSEELR